jgi:hypothetical protein
VATVNAVMTGWQPTFPSFWHYLGAVLRAPVLSSLHGPGDFLEEVVKIWERYGDRGWAVLAQYFFEPDDDVAYFSMRSWLLHNRAAWPSTILQWPEQTIRDAVAMHQLLGFPYTIPDCLYAVWPLLRKDEKEVAAMLGGDPSQSMYSVLSTWGQFPYPLLPSTAGNLWLEFMRAYRRKRRPLTYNPTSLIGKDPYIVAKRLERGEF